MKALYYFRLIAACSLLSSFSFVSFGQAPPQNFNVDPLSSLATWQAPENGQATGYEIYLGDSLLASLADTVFDYQIACLDYNTDYVSSIYAIYNDGNSQAIDFLWTSTYLYTVQQPFIEPNSQSVTFMLQAIPSCGPNSSDIGLLGFFIYKNNEFFGFFPFEQGDDYVMAVDINAIGFNTYCASTVYDLGAFGFPAQTASSSLECQSVNVFNGIELPFMENWDFGSFETNNWTFDTDNWKIDSQNGNEKPSAKFHRIGVLNNYSSSLFSNTIDAQNIKVGHVYLKFDLKLDDYNNNGSEYLKIMVSDSTGWHSIDSVSNTGSFDWETHTYDIRDYSLGQVFQFKFEAAGENSMNILDWFIDNIEVYRECDAPEDLVAYIVWVGDSPANEISWSAPNSMVENELWKHWDMGSNSHGIELTCDQCNIEVAARWTPPMIEELFNDTIESIKFYSQSNYSSDVIIKVRNGENGSTVIYQDTISNIIGNTWTTHTLSEPVVIQAQTELWISYEVPYSDLGIFGFGADNGPGMSGFSDLIKYSTDGEWTTLSSFGMDYNWNLQFSVVSEPVFDTSELLGFNVYRKWMRSYIYEKIRFVEFPIDNSWYSIKDTCFNPPCNAFYKVNAVWANEGDTCLSNYGRSYDFPMEDYVYIIYEGMEDKEPLNKISVYPNPVSNQLIIESENKLQGLVIYNAFGQMVKSYNNMNSSKITIDVSQLDKGIYIIKAFGKNHVYTAKLLKN